MGGGMGDSEEERHLNGGGDSKGEEKRSQLPQTWLWAGGRSGEEQTRLQSERTLIEKIQSGTKG